MLSLIRILGLAMLSTSTKISSEVMQRALAYFQFSVAVVQTDNGQEFGDYLERMLKEQKIRLRHTRVKKPNDNAHVEQFIRTIQEECFDFGFPKQETIVQKLSTHIAYYNTKRLHLGIYCLAPRQMLPRS